MPYIPQFHTNTVDKNLIPTGLVQVYICLCLVDGRSCTLCWQPMHCCSTKIRSTPRPSVLSVICCSCVMAAVLWLSVTVKGIMQCLLSSVCVMRVWTDVNFCFCPWSFSPRGGHHLQHLVERAWAYGCVSFKKVLANTVEDAQKLKMRKSWRNRRSSQIRRSMTKPSRRNSQVMLDS